MRLTVIPVQKQEEQMLAAFWELCRIRNMYVTIQPDMAVSVPT